MLGVPDKAQAVLCTGDTVHTAAVKVVLLQYLNTFGDELQISNKVFVRLIDIRQDEMLAFYSLLLGLVLFLIGHLKFSRLFLTVIDSMVSAGDVPCYHLAIHTSTNQNIWVLGVELKHSDFNWGSEDVIGRQRGSL